MGGVLPRDTIPRLVMYCSMCLHGCVGLLVNKMGMVMGNWDSDRDCRNRRNNVTACDVLQILKNKNVGVEKCDVRKCTCMYV